MPTKRRKHKTAVAKKRRPTKRKTTKRTRGRGIFSKFGKWVGKTWKKSKKLGKLAFKTLKKLPFKKIGKYMKDHKLLSKGLFLAASKDPRLLPAAGIAKSVGLGKGRRRLVRRRPVMRTMGRGLSFSGRSGGRGLNFSGGAVMRSGSGYTRIR